jgi:3',5'-cyclic AMP phosphodiesterase CpdA
MFTGDLVNTPKTSELELFIKHANKLMYPWYAIDGNHDIGIDGPLTKEKFMSVLGENNSKMKQKNIYYSFTPKRGYRVICLDSIIDTRVTTNGRISSEQLEWLKSELDKYKNETIIICRSYLYLLSKHRYKISLLKLRGLYFFAYNKHLKGWDILQDIFKESEVRIN